MINRDEIEAGDKVYTRDGGCLVARMSGELIVLGSMVLFDAWDTKGRCASYDHPLDIIRIEKAPKPVVKEIYVAFEMLDKYEENYYASHKYDIVSHWDNIIKLTIINGKLDKAEQVK